MTQPMRQLLFSAAGLAATLILAPDRAWAEQAEAHDRGERHQLRRLAELRPMIQGRGFLGIEVLHITADLRQHFGASEDAGVLVSRVLEDGPAAQAGLKVGDVITAINDDQIDAEMDVLRAVRPLKKGATANLDIVRDGRSMSLAVTIDERARERVDLGDVMRWKSADGEEHHLPPEAVFRGRDGNWVMPRIPRDLGERISRSLEGIDWKEIADKAGRSSEELEKRLADLEKRLAELQKKLDAAVRR